MILFLDLFPAGKYRKFLQSDDHSHTLEVEMTGNDAKQPYRDDIPKSKILFPLLSSECSVCNQLVDCQGNWISSRPGNTGYLTKTPCQ